MILWIIATLCAFFIKGLCGFANTLVFTSILGFGLSISVCYYNMYMNLYDKAKITALHYSLSGRVAERLDVLLWE